MAELERPSYHLIDLRQIAIDLGEHYNHVLRDEYPGTCLCNEEVSQQDDQCPICNVPIVWRSSRVWRSQYGDPEKAIKRLSVTVPTDPIGKRICARAKEAGFANRGEYRRLRKAVKRIGEKQANECIDLCIRKKPAASGRGLIAYILNALDKRARENEIIKEREEKTGAYDVYVPRD